MGISLMQTNCKLALMNLRITLIGKYLVLCDDPILLIFCVMTNLYINLGHYTPMF